MEKKTWKQKAIQFCHSEYLPFAVFGIVFFFMICRTNFQDNSDDTYFQKMFAQYGIIPFLKQRYFTWSGRMSVELIIGLMNFNLPLWKIINSFMAAFLLLCISKYATAQVEEKQKRKIINTFLCCSLFAFYPYTVTSGMVWYTGCFNYLWPTTALLCALLPFYYAMVGRKTVYKITYLLYFIATAYACYVEQQLAIFVVFGALTFIYLKMKKESIPHKLIPQYFFGLMNVVVYGLAPGTRIRAGQELHWYPDYPMLTKIDRIFQAVNWTNRHILIASNLLFLIFSIFLFTVCYARYKNSKAIIAGSSIPMLFSVLRIIPFNVLLSRAANFQHGTAVNPYQSGATSNTTIDIERALDKLFYNCTAANPSNIDTSYKSLFPSIMCFTVILFSAVLLLFAFNRKEIKFISITLFFAAIASGYIMAFSPTIFASGSRVFFVTDVLILIIIGLLFKELLTESDIMQKKRVKFTLYGMIAFAGIMVLTYIGNFVNQILWL